MISLCQGFGSVGNIIPHAKRRLRLLGGNNRRANLEEISVKIG